jgi:hypothetical protein
MKLTNHDVLLVVVLERPTQWSVTEKRKLRNGPDREEKAPLRNYKRKVRKAKNGVTHFLSENSRVSSASKHTQQ